MILREPCLPLGWYPREKTEIAHFLESYNTAALGQGAIAPHAGWYYSGRSAALAVSSLDRDAQTVVVMGGHLPGGMPLLLAEEDGVKTPLGIIDIDRELREEFKARAAGLITPRPDRYNDNTVEILLPMVRYFFPSSDLLWLRFPSERSSYDAGKLLAQSAQSIGRKIVVLGSTDLTHYGDNYGFSPKGRGKPALDWVKKVNDAAFIDAVLGGDHMMVLQRAEEDFSACSAGAVLGVLGFSAEMGIQGKLLDYRTSADADEGEVPGSFVGYAAFSFGPAF